MIYLVHLSSLEVDMDQFEVCLVYSVRWSGWSSKFILIHQVLRYAGLYWTVLGCTWMYWAVLDCTGLYWGVLCCGGL